MIKTLGGVMLGHVSVLVLAMFLPGCGGGEVLFVKPSIYSNTGTQITTFNGYSKAAVMPTINSYVNNKAKVERDRFMSLLLDGVPNAAEIAALDPKVYAHDNGVIYERMFRIMLSKTDARWKKESYFLEDSPSGAVLTIWCEEKTLKNGVKQGIDCSYLSRDIENIKNINK